MKKYVLLLFFYLLQVNGENIACPYECVCNMTNGLRSAICTGEKLTTVEIDIPSEVQYVDYSYNYISQLTDDMFTKIKLQNLIALNISHNMMSVISLRAFNNLKYIQIIDLSDNVLHTLWPKLFETNKYLKKLFLGGNQFGNIENEPFLESDSLEVLDISNCLIPHIHPKFFSKLPSLKTIDISKNFLIQLDLKVFENLSKLNILNFNENKIDCNSKTNELIHYLQTHQILFDNICQKIEKSQKMIIMPDQKLEKDHLLNWSFDSCDIETNNDIIQTTETKCEIIYDNKMMSMFLFALIFSCGTIFGVFASCSYMSCAYIMKKRRNRNIIHRNPRINNTRRSRIVRCNSLVTRPQKREEFLLAENSFDIGLSTPVLSRSRPSTVIK